MGQPFKKKNRRQANTPNTQKLVIFHSASNLFDDWALAKYDVNQGTTILRKKDACIFPGPRLNHDRMLLKIQIEHGGHSPFWLSKIALYPVVTAATR